MTGTVKLTPSEVLAILKESPLFVLLNEADVHELVERIIKSLKPRCEVIAYDEDYNEGS